MDRPLQFEVNGGHLAGERHEDGPPTVIALHAGVADRRGWREMAAHLTGAATLVSYDRRGFGDSPPASRPFSHLDDLKAVVDALGVGPVWLLGNSMGGRLALDLALHAPEQVAGLILLSPAISGAPEDPLDSDTERLADLIDAAGEDLDEVNRLETWLWLDGPASREGRVGGSARALALTMNAIVLAGERDQAELEQDPDTGAWSRLSEIGVPVTVACGTIDVPAIVDQGRRLAKAVPSGSFVALGQLAHLPALEAPAAVANLVAQTLAAGR